MSSSSPDPALMREAADVLSRGGLVAFPTETVYGLGADAFNVSAVERVFEVKGRPLDNPLIVHIADAEHLRGLTREIPAKASVLAEVFWPGPLTLVLKRSPEIQDRVTAGLDAVAVRIPDHDVTREIIRILGRGIVGPSANKSGRPSPTKPEHVYEDLQGLIELIVDAGPTRMGLESTVVDVTTDPPVILRLGALSRDAIESVIGPVETTGEERFLRRSPGSGHHHYAPRAKIILINEGDSSRYSVLVDSFRNQGKKTAGIVHSFVPRQPEALDHAVVQVENVGALSKNLFDLFRSFDRSGVDAIIVESVLEDGLGAAVMDRIKRAAARPQSRHEHAG